MMKMSDHQNQRMNIEMSQEAVDQRLRDVAELYRLGMSIKQAKYLGKARDILPSADEFISHETEKKPSPEIGFPSPIDPIQ
ncbi:MAG: hypothetical protein K1Y36_30695 [Blastocatellia bacterium]|nr:hypothetical protein [Blastocatellia bacterium]